MTKPTEEPPTLKPKGGTGAHKISGERIEGHTLHLGRSKVIDTLVDTAFVDCTIRIHCGASNLTLARCRFENCTIWPAKEMRNLRVPTCTFEGCTFVGRYSGARFGDGVRGCDFSGVKSLDLCDFGPEADIASCRWPTWPHVTIVEPMAHRAELEALDVSFDLGLTLEIVAEPPAASACTVDLSRYDDDLDMLRTKFESLDFVRFDDA